jgi:hypothetical protein
VTATATLTIHTCTAFTPEGRPHRCGRRDGCTRVVLRHKGRTVEKHWVCGDCRERMKLPDHSVAIDEHQRMRPWRG